MYFLDIKTKGVSKQFINLKKRSMGWPSISLAISPLFSFQKKCKLWLKRKLNLDITLDLTKTDSHTSAMIDVYFSIYIFFLHSEDDCIRQQVYFLLK